MVACRVAIIALFIAVALHVDLAAAVAGVIVTPEMIVVGHALQVVVTSITVTMGAVIVVTGTRIDARVAIDITRAAGRHQNQRTSRST